MIYMIFLISFGMAQYEAPSNLASPPGQVLDYLTVLESVPHPCDGSDKQKSCERHIIFDKATDSIHILLSDGRNFVSGNMDINAVLKSPETYGGSINSVELKTEFNLAGKKIESVSANFQKDGRLSIKLTTNEENLTKIVDL